MATNEYRGSGDERKQYTEWHRVVLWGQFSKFAGDYLHKGDNVYVEGRLQTRKWKDSEGRDHYATEVVAVEFQGINRGRTEAQSAGHEEASNGRGPGRR